MNESYSEKLKDPRWQKKRLEIFQRDNWTCVSCNKNDLTLHVHHLRYYPGMEPWEYHNSILVTYCELCHNTEHLIGGQISRSLIDIIEHNKLYIKPLAQLCTLTDCYPAFYDQLKEFLNESMISYLKTKTETDGNDRLDKVA